ncbi:MAG: ABC transporter ATP-binding protein [Planctomycetaceae bacterium]|nr:ABC transporter ATP-binding protein [Planctomycetaceae bacterium]
MSALLEVKELTRSFDARRVVDQLSFSVSAGEAFGLLGPNGAGKSTTMMMICGILEADSGTVTLAGEPLSGQDPNSRQRLGVVPQDLAIYPELTARENLQFFGSLYHLPRPLLEERVNHALQQVGLEGRANDKAETFSGGMKRRLNFAAAILHQPSVLILDEPTVGVDPQSRAHLMQCVRDLQQLGTAIIYCSHYMEEVEALCARAAIIDHGKLLACDTVSGLLRQIPAEVEIRITGGSPVADLREIAGLKLDESDGSDIRVLRFEQRVATQQASETGDLSVAVADVLQALAERQFHVLSIHTFEPSLERLFLKLTGARLRD